MGTDGSEQIEYVLDMLGTNYLIENPAGRDYDDAIMNALEDKIKARMEQMEEGETWNFEVVVNDPSSQGLNDSIATAFKVARTENGYEFDDPEGGAMLVPNYNPDGEAYPPASWVHEQPNAQIKWETDYVEYTVTLHDTLASIADQLREQGITNEHGIGVTSYDLADLNGMQYSERLEVGETLKLPAGTDIEKLDTKPPDYLDKQDERTTEPETDSPDEGGETDTVDATPADDAASAAEATDYTIQQGDSLSVIVQDHYEDPGDPMDWHEIKELSETVADKNGIDNINEIQAGQTLHLPSEQELTQGSDNSDQPKTGREEPEPGTGPAPVASDLSGLTI